MADSEPMLPESTNAELGQRANKTTIKQQRDNTIISDDGGLKHLIRNGFIFCHLVKTTTF